MMLWQEVRVGRLRKNERGRQNSGIGTVKKCLSEKVAIFLDWGKYSFGRAGRFCNACTPLSACATKRRVRC